MSRAIPPPSLPPALVDGLLEGLGRVAAVADLLESAAEPGPLRNCTVAAAAGIIGGEADRMLRLVHQHESSIQPESQEP